jgi:hypothetical protein
VQHVVLRRDPAWPAIRGDLFDARLRQLLQEERDLGEQPVDRFHRAQPPVGAPDDVGAARHRASGRSMM